MLALKRHAAISRKFMRSFYYRPISLETHGVYSGAEMAPAFLPV
jgi:hypothetical protein